MVLQGLLIHYWLQMDREYLILSPLMHQFNAEAMLFSLIPLQVILFPIHILSFGLLSIAVYVGIFYLSGKVFDLPTIKSWIFPGGSFLGITVGKVTLSYLGNLAAVSRSVSGIITILEKMT